MNNLFKTMGDIFKYESLPDFSKSFQKMKINDALREWLVWAEDSLIKTAVQNAINNNRDIIPMLGDMIDDNTPMMNDVLGKKLVNQIVIYLHYN